ncbi:hypothetical protein LTR78_003795 [Recurvomyces mirabilis]|uniref:Uncharacterized protein n=1 Tax=Recurvomyces mirabilis TaxID=574656 RepID=A0AAE0WRX9_9PEZI|nr:hypothetical protein LTR78_003795 [Recurvomyces mirabilis]KAK5154907.1 hypothetical protein LTS14_006488 [Recurvomyces mirabilis]
MSAVLEAWKAVSWPYTECCSYDKKRKFVDEGVSLRKKFQGATGGESEENDASGYAGILLVTTLSG